MWFRSATRAKHLRIDVPVAGTPSIPTFNERLQMDPLFLGDMITWHITDVFSKYPILTRVRPKNPQEVLDTFLPSWVGVFGISKCLHLDEGGEWKNDPWRDLRENAVSN